MRPWWLLLLLLPLAQASPGVAIIVHHPFPDDADPLGIDMGGRDGFVQRHGKFDANGDGFDFPVFVADGLQVIEGLPEGADPMQATEEAYLAAVASRLKVESPIDMVARAIVLNGTLRVVVQMSSTADLSGEDLQAWVAVVEQPVHYQPPPALSNGVFDHPFTLRALQNLGPVSLPHEVRNVSPWNDDWDADKILVAVWLEQSGSHGSRFAPGEVAQAVFHKLGDQVTETRGRTVLVEAYSASWCGPCLFGDRALEAVGATYGIAIEPSESNQPTYWRSPPVWLWPILALVAIGMMIVRLPGDP